MSQKGLAPILVMVLLAAALVGGYLVYQNQTKLTPPQQTAQPKPKPSPNPSNVNPESTTSGETTNWKTYTNTEWQFSLKYPPDWLEGSPSNNFYIPNQGVRSFGIIFGPPTTTNHIGEKISPTATAGVAIDIISAEKNELDNYSSCVSKQVDLRRLITINGKPASLFKNESLCGLGDNRDVVYVVNNGKLYEITINHYGITDQILSTFKFLP